MLGRFAARGGLSFLFSDERSSGRAGCGLSEVMRSVYWREDGPARKIRDNILEKAVKSKEFVAVSTDATFKIAFGIIGQEKMTQKEGEVHAVHTFRGATGLCPGFSGQRSEGAEDFKAATLEVLPAEARLQTRYLYSDAPNETMRSAFPNIVGVAADFAHLVFRCEYCTGSKRTRCTGRLMQLQVETLINKATAEIRPCPSESLK